MKTSKRSPVFAPICGPAVSDVLDELLGADAVGAAEAVRQRAGHVPERGRVAGAAPHLARRLRPRLSTPTASSR